MQNLFPLPESLWLDWLADEASSAQTGDEFEELWELCELALEDFVSINIWCFYLT